MALTAGIKLGPYEIQSPLARVLLWEDLHRILA